MSVQGESGQIKVIQYTSNQLITPVVESLLKVQELILAEDTFLIREEVWDRAKQQLRRVYKKSLTIHCNGDYFSEDRNIGYSMIKQMEYIKDVSKYQSADIIRMQLGYKQVFLSYYYQCQKLMSEIISGEELVVDEQGGLNKSGQKITVFSAKFKEMISQNRDRGYRIASARVNHVFYWNEEGKEEVRVLFPEVEFVKVRIGGEEK